MAADVPTRLATSRRPGRRFGLELGIAAIVAGLLLLKHHPGISVAGGAVGVTLVVVAVGRPSMLDPVARRWLALGASLAGVTTPLVLALLYLSVVTPIAFLRRTLGRSPFTRDPHSDSYWIVSTTRTSDERRSRMERQF